MSINLKDTTYLLNNGFIMVTKKGTAWRCGRGYRKDWSKLIGKEVLLHNKPYILTNRVKKDNKWYLVFTDGTNNYTELQTKALHNKNMAKDTIIVEAVKKELIDKIIEEVEQITNKHFNSHNKPSKYYHSFKSAVAFIKRNGRFYRDKLPGYYRELSNCYHPDRHNTYLYQQPYTAEDYMSVIQTLKPQKRSKRSNKPAQLLLPAPKELIDIVVEEIDDVIRKINNIRAEGKQAMLNDSANYTKKGTLRKKVAQQIESWYKPFALYNEYIQGKDTLEYCNYTTNNGRSWCGVRQLVEANDFNCKCAFIEHYIMTYVGYTSYTHVNKLSRQLKKIYHPDNKVTGDNKKFEYISNWAFNSLNANATIHSIIVQKYKVEEQLLSRAGHISELYKNLCMEELCINAYTRPTIASMLNSIFMHSNEQYEQYYQDLLDYYKLDEQITELIKQEYAKFIEEYNFLQSRKRAI